MGKEVDWAWEEEGRPSTDSGRLPNSGRPCARPMELPMMDWYRESKPCRSGAADSPAYASHRHLSTITCCIYCPIPFNITRCKHFRAWLQAVNNLNLTKPRWTSPATFHCGKRGVEEARIRVTKLR